MLHSLIIYSTQSNCLVLQRGFYYGLASIPAMYLLYYSASGENPYWTRVLRMYSDYSDEWVRRNDIHNTAVQQAILDRTLFIDRPRENTPDTVFANPEYVRTHTLTPGISFSVEIRT